MTSISFMDSPLAGAGFVPTGMRAIFGFEAYLQFCVDAEVAWRVPRLTSGIITDAAAAGIAAAAKTYRFDMDRLRRETGVVGYPILPMVEQLAGAAASVDETIAALTRLAKVHRDTPMAGRTHLQHALPVTFG